MNSEIGASVLSPQMLEERDFSVQVFMAQLFLVPLACLVLGFLCALFVVSALGLSRAGGDVAGHVIFALTGLCVGYRMQMKFPGFYWSGGRWVWVPLVLLFSYGVHTDGLIGWFSSDPKYRSDAIAIVLLTEPTIATCTYSVGVAVAKRRADRRRAGR